MGDKPSFQFYLINVHMTHIGVMFKIYFDLRLRACRWACFKRVSPLLDIQIMMA